MFELKKKNTTIAKEMIAGLTTFASMAYIIIVNPLVLEQANMPFNAVATATILSSCISTFLIGILTNYPFAIAPGMGLNAYFTFTAVSYYKLTWQEALGACLVSEICILFLILLGMQKKVIHAIPKPLKVGTTAGIGGFLILIALQNMQGDLFCCEHILALAGLIFTAILMYYRIPIAFLLTILLLWAAGLFLGITSLEEEQVSFFSLNETFLKLKIKFSFETLLVTTGFLLVAFIDPAGTLLGLAGFGKFLDKEGRLPKINKALFSVSFGSILSALLGSSPETVYLESASGITSGGKTGLTSVFVSLLFLLAFLFLPIISSIPFFATFPVLIFIGIMLLLNFKQTLSHPLSEIFPAFLIMISIPLTYSIVTGISLGIISYPLCKILSGNYRDVSKTLWILFILFLIQLTLIIFVQ